MIKPEEQVCRYHSISEHLLGIDTFTRMPSHVAVAGCCFRWSWTSMTSRKKLSYACAESNSYTIKNHFFRLQTTSHVLQMAQNIHSYIIKELLHWYRWIVSLDVIILYNYWCLRGPTSRFIDVCLCERWYWRTQSRGQYHLSHPNKSWYWSLQTPMIVLLLFCEIKKVGLISLKQQKCQCRDF